MCIMALKNAISSFYDVFKRFAEIFHMYLKYDHNDVLPSLSTTLLFSRSVAIKAMNFW